MRRRSVADVQLPDLVASFFTLSGAGFGEPPRNSFVERCEAAAAAGFAGIGLHAEDLPRTVAGGTDIGEMQSVLRINGMQLVEIEFLGGWALPPVEGTRAGHVGPWDRGSRASAGWATRERGGVPRGCLPGH